MKVDRDFRLGDWIVSPLTNSVVGPAGEAHLEPKAMQVLTVLADRAGDVVSKQELLSRVWEGTFVSDEVLPNAIWELRRALGDDAKKPRFIQTLPKKGYRLIAPVAPANGADAETEPSRPHRRMWPFAAGAAALALAGGLLFWRTPEPTAAMDPASRPSSIAVMGFENLTSATEHEWLSTGVPTMLRTGLAEVSELQVVSDARFDQAALEGDVRRDVARRAGAEAVVIGSIFRHGSDYRIDVQIERVSDARIVSAHSVRGGDVFALVDELTSRVRESLHAGPVRAAPVPPLREMTTASLEAFRLYNEGVEARKHLRLGDARRFLTEAVKIDPDFALAYVELQWISAWSKDEAAYELYHRKTREHERHLPPHKRTLIQAEEISKEDPARAVSLLEDTIASYPGEEDAYLQLAFLLRKRYRMTDSVQVLERGVAAIPHSGYLRLYYGYGLLWEGRYPEAFSQFETYSRINPGEANPWDSLGEAYLIAGIPDRALERYERSLEIDPNFASSYLGRAWAFGMLGRYEEALAALGSIGEELPPGYSRAEVHLFQAYLLSRAGRYAETNAVLAVLERLEAARGESPSATLDSALRMFRALLSLERGAPGDALAAIEAAGGDGQEPQQLLALSKLLGGIAACRSGDMTKAREYLVELGKIHEKQDPRETWWYHLLLGEIALTSGDARAAYSAFKQGEPKKKLHFSVNQLLPSLGGSLIFRDGAARAKQLSGDVKGARDAYRELLRPDIGQKWTALREPRYALELARLEREAGNREAASRHYREFLELWKRADPNLPEVVEARTYLGTS